MRLVVQPAARSAGLGVGVRRAREAALSRRADRRPRRLLQHLDAALRVADPLLRRGDDPDGVGDRRARDGDEEVRQAERPV